MTTRTLAATAAALPADTSLDRRTMLASAGAVAILAAIATPVADAALAKETDALLLALREPFDLTWRAYAAALEVHSAAEGAAWSLGALPANDARRAAADERHEAADAVVGSTSDANREVVDEMCRRPARTIEGLVFKARVSLEHEDNLYAELVTSIMDDIIAMDQASRLVG